VLDQIAVIDEPVEALDDVPATHAELAGQPDGLDVSRDGEVQQGGCSAMYTRQTANPRPISLPNDW
jgi:hypothetical protein